MLHLYTVDDGQGNVHRTKYRGIIHATVSITREEGLLALYRVTLLYIVCSDLMRFFNLHQTGPVKVIVKPLTAVHN